jgi:hypothetical protein
MLARAPRAIVRYAIAGAFVAPIPALWIVGCGDDTVVPLPDGSTPDAHALDATVPDAADTADVVDLADADTGCRPYDASHLEGVAVQAGRALALALKCAKCHGDQLSGNPNGVQSPQTEGGLAYPPNLTPDPGTGLGCWTDDQIESAFLHGVDNEGQPLCPPMPRFANAGVDASGAADLLAFLRSLPTVSLQVPNTPDCTQSATGGDGGGPDVAEAGTEASEAGGTDANDASDATTADAD